MKLLKKSTNAEDWLKKVEESGYKMTEQQKEDYHRMHGDSLEGRAEEFHNSLIELCNVIIKYINELREWLKRKIG